MLRLMSKMANKRLARQLSNMNLIYAAIAVVLLGAGQTSCAITCNVEQEKRVLCGSLHPTEQDCINRGCCFDVKIKSCFLKLYESASDEVLDPINCEVENNVKEPCGLLDITEDGCNQRGCCWNAMPQDNVLCFAPKTSSSYSSSEMTENFLYFLLGLKPKPYTTTSSTTTTTATTTIIPEQYTENATDIFSLLKQLEINYNADDILPSTPALTTGAVTTTTDSQNSSSIANYDQNIDDIQSSDELQAFLNEYLAKLQAEPASCSKASQISCCVHDPTGPCCEFSKPVAPSESARVPGPRIVGGAPAGYLKTSMAYLSKRHLESQFCGGTLIHKKFVVTAAHCVLDYCDHTKPPNDLVVKLGKRYKRNYVWENHHVQIKWARKITCHINHCKSGDNPRLNDVALIELSTPVVITKWVSFAQMPNHLELPDENKDCVVLGWGETRGTGFARTLKQVTVPYFTNERCNLLKYRNCSVRACMLCAGGLGKDPCKGDSGGPLFCQSKVGVYTFHGVYSWGRCGSHDNKPAVYTRVSYFKNWMNRVIKNSTMTD